MKWFWALLGALLMLPWTAGASTRPMVAIRLVDGQANTGNFGSGVVNTPRGAEVMYCQVNYTEVGGTTPTAQLTIRGCDADHVAAKECAAVADTSIWYAGSAIDVSSGSGSEKLLVAPMGLVGDFSTLTDAEAVGPLPQKFLVWIVEGGTWADLDATVDCVFW